MDFKRKFDLRTSSLSNPEPEVLAEIASQLSPSPLRHSAVLGGGFSNTNIVLEFADGERCVLRVSAHNERLNMEADLLHYLSREAPEVPIPKVLWRASEHQLGGLAAFVMTYIAGEPLASVEDSLSRADCRHICEQLALIAAQIHKIRFAQCGLLGPGPKVIEPFASYVAGTVGFFESCLDNPNLQRRVGVRRLERLRHCLTQRADLHQPSWTHQLCHSDFNQKNLLIQRNPNGRYHVAAVLDWEFALSHPASSTSATCWVRA